MDILALSRLEHELAIWRRAWKPPVLWWRDDDCRLPTWKLDRLLYLSAGLPITLAVIPDGDLNALAARLEKVPGVSIAQHGVDHANKLPEPGPRSEFPPDMAQDQVNASVVAGRARLTAAGLAPRLFVPPWNEADHRLKKAILAAGYSTYSIGIYGQASPGLAHIGAQVDVLRWKGEPRFRGQRRIFDALRTELEHRRASSRFDEPIGLLTHHLVHDESTWAFLDWFLKFSRTRFEWRSLDDLCAPSSVPAASPLFASRLARSR